MEGASIFSDKARKSGKIDFQTRLGKASKEERIEIAKLIASTIEKSDEEIDYINTANLQDMHREERIWIAKMIVATMPYDRGCVRC